MDKETPILITGGTGFIGSYILRTLVARGFKNITATKRTNSKMDLVQPVQDLVSWVEVDILDTSGIYDVVKKTRAVIHAAAEVSFDHRDQKKILAVNVDGTTNVVNACLEYGIHRFVHVSSIAVFSRKSGPQEISEKTDWDYQDPATNYAISKYKAEMEVWRAGAEGLPIAIINPSLVLGAGFWNSGSASLFKKVYEGLKFYPKGINGFVDVRDVAHAAVLLLNSTIVNERFIINAENRSYRDITSMMAGAMNLAPPSIELNALLREAALLRAWILRTFLGRQEVISRGTLRNAQNDFYFDSTKSREQLGLKYIGIEETINSSAKLLLESAKTGFPARYLPIAQD